MSDTPIVSIRNLELSFSTNAKTRTKAVKGVSIDLHAGEIVGLAGESGSGKSATALSIPQLLPRGVSRIDNGKILLEGRDVANLSREQLRRLRRETVSVVFQEPMTSLSPAKRVGALLIEAIRTNSDLSRAEARLRALELLEKVHLRDPDRVMAAYPFELSGGMRQRVMIAVAFCNNPKVLIADEPTTALDVTVQAEVLDLIRDMSRESRCAVLFICHDLAVVSQICDRVYVMRHGKIVETGPVDQVLQRPQHAYTRGLIECLPDQHLHRARLPGPGGPAQASIVARPEIKADQEGEVISLQNIDVEFVVGRDWRGRRTRSVSAVRSISLSVSRGETLSIVGESGSGKTTLARTVMGLQIPTGGIAKVLGKAPATAAKAGKLQIVFQDPRSSLNPRMPAWQIVTEPLFIQGERKGLRDRAADLLVRTGLSTDVLDRGPRDFSGGERQRLAIARALATNPEILVLDEPTSALDASVQAQILNLLLDLQDEFSLTYLLITHDMAVVSHISDRVAVLKSGEVVESGLAETIIGAAEHDYTRRLMSARPILRK